MAKTVWARSRERFLFLFGNGSKRNREWGLLGRDSPEREQREVIGVLIQQYQEIELNGRKVTLDYLLN